MTINVLLTISICLLLIFLWVMIMEKYEIEGGWWYWFLIWTLPWLLFVFLTRWQIAIAPFPSEWRQENECRIMYGGNMTYTWSNNKYMYMCNSTWWALYNIPKYKE